MSQKPIPIKEVNSTACLLQLAVLGCLLDLGQGRVFLLPLLKLRWASLQRLPQGHIVTHPSLTLCYQVTFGSVSCRRQVLRGFTSLISNLRPLQQVIFPLGLRLWVIHTRVSSWTFERGLSPSASTSIVSKLPSPVSVGQVRLSAARGGS